MKVLFVIPTLSSSYHQFRVFELKKQGVHCFVTGFDRDSYPGKPWGMPVYSLGYVEHMRYHKRIGTLLKSIPSIRKQSDGMDAIICFNLDLLFITWLALTGVRNKPELIYDVGDIRTSLVKKGLISKILRSVERFLLKRISLLMVTSEAYITEYFEGIQGMNDVDILMLENKLNKDDTPAPLPRKQDPWSEERPVTIGYFGVLRCRKSLKLLNKLALEGNGKVQVIVRGVYLDTDDLDGMIRDNPYMSYKGPYVFPDDLAKIHAEVDLSWLVHAHTRQNTMWARIFRFYHACFYGIPMIAQSGSKDGDEVIRHNIGFCVDIENPDDAIQRILNIKPADYQIWNHNVQQLPGELYLITDEFEKLKNHIQKKAEKKKFNDRKGTDFI